MNGAKIFFLSNIIFLCLAFQFCNCGKVKAKGHGKDIMQPDSDDDEPAKESSNSEKPSGGAKPNKQSGSASSNKGYLPSIFQ